MTLLNAQGERVAKKIENGPGKRVAVMHALKFQHFLNSMQNIVLAGILYLFVPIMNLISFLASALTPVYLSGCDGQTDSKTLCISLQVRHSKKIRA
jgi:hypothetical protein